MDIINSIPDFKMTVNPVFLEKAEALKPKLSERRVSPVRLVRICKQGDDFAAEPAGEADDLSRRALVRGESVCLDFGGHHMGYIALRLESVGSPQDAPAYLRIRLGEIPYEMGRDFAGYHGDISRSWLQEEYLHIDVLPAEVRLPRRYAFRYLEISVIDTSPKYKLIVRGKETEDTETLRELFPTAERQIELSLAELDERGVVRDRETWWCFLDWGEGLNKQAGAQAILIYALKQARQMALWLKDSQKAEYYKRQAELVTEGALSCLWDAETGLFVSGRRRQFSWASQVWFVLAEVFDREKNCKLLKRLIQENPPVKMATPYMYHYFVEALMENGLTDLAADTIRSYWGGMAREGADTFYEVYDRSDRFASPYGDRLINSFCHAWSGTPAYFIRKYLT